MSVTELPPAGLLELLPPDSDTRADPITCDAPILLNRPEIDRYWRLVLHAPSIARNVQPGQFVMLTPTRPGQTWPVLPRPMAVYDTDPATGSITILYGVVGAGTQHMTTFTKSERITTVGPLGRAFSLPPSTTTLLTIGRGIGTCSLTLLAAHSQRTGIDVTVIASGRAPHATVGTEFYRVHGIRALEVHDSDGSSSPEKLTPAISALVEARPPDVIAVCGSQRLSTLAQQLARTWGSQVQVSLEAHMACGLGYCHGCSTGQRAATAEAPLICKDGPVFRLTNETDRGD